MLAGAFSFAVMGAISFDLNSRCNWQIVLLARTVVALVLSVVSAYLSGVPLVFLGPKALWVRSLAGSAGIVCTFFALTHLPVSDAATLINTTPIWVSLLLWIQMRKPVSVRVVLAVTCGITGIVAIQQPHFAAAKVAVGFGIGSAFFVAIAMISLHKLGEVSPLAVVVHFSTFSTITGVALVLASAPDIRYAGLMTAVTLVMLLGVGVSGMLGQLAMTRAFAIGRPTGVAVVGLSQVPFAVVFDVVIWGRVFDPLTVIGIVLVTLPVGWLLRHDSQRSEKVRRLQTIRPAAVQADEAEVRQ